MLLGTLDATPKFPNIPVSLQGTLGLALGSPIFPSGCEGKLGVGKAGNPFQTTQGNRLSCRDQEGRRGSEEAVPGPSVFPSGVLLLSRFSRV